MKFPGPPRLTRSLASPSGSVGHSPLAAFSLIELLVTLALLLVMVYMWHGFGSRGNQIRQKKACEKNLLTTYMALEIYANEHDGQFPIVPDARSSEDALALLVPRYTVASDKFVCPGSKDSSIPPATPLAEQRISYTYFMGRTLTDTGAVVMSDRLINPGPKAAGEAVFSGTGKPPGNTTIRATEEIFCLVTARSVRPDPRFLLPWTPHQTSRCSIPNKNKTTTPQPERLMKIVCSCGIKYGFDTSPEMVRRPIRFVCQSCGADNSDLVNQLIREEYGATETAAAAPAAPVVAPTPPSPQPPSAPSPASRPSLPSPTPVSRVRIASHNEPSASASAPTASTSQASQFCGKHPGQEVAATCVVCHKPMCSLCMQVTGFVCSPFCRTKAEAQGMVIPEFEGQSNVTTRKEWRKVSLVAGAIVAVIAAALGFWFWYAWIGSAPRVAYAHKFPALAESGRMHLAAQQQLIVLHGGTLTRHDLENGKLIWSLQLLDTNRITADAAKEWESMKAAWAEELKNGADGNSYRLPTLERFTQGKIAEAAAALGVYVEDQNIWLSSPGKLTRYAWADGKSDKEIPVDESLDEPEQIGQELVFVGPGAGGKESSLRVNLTTGDSRSEGLAKPAAVANARPGAKTPGTAPAASAAGGNQPTPASLAARAQSLPTPNRLALPATIAAAENQRRLAAAMRDDGDGPRPFPRKPQANPEVTERLRTPNGIIELSTRMLEERVVTREAMKAPPKKSALEGTVNQAATAAIANELLNEMQRDRGGSTVEEDQSRYQITVRRGQSIQPWTGEVNGPPSFYALKTTDIIAAGKGLVALDKNNKKLWDAKLNFAVSSGGRFEALEELHDSDEAGLSKGAGPCIERGDIIYVVDQGMLTSFTRANGNVRWRLPSVGIAGIWFDDQGMLYVNSTTASPDVIKYSKQIDITTKVDSQVLKVDPETGKTLWYALNEGMVAYVWGKFIYTAESHQGNDTDEEDRVLGVTIGMEIPTHVRLKRLDAANGRVLWEHYQKRYPLDVHFDRNTIQLLFKKEVQNLRFIVL